MEGSLDASSFIFLHTVSFPFYVQSYATSLVPSLEIFVTEYENEGSGLSIYKNLISREDNTLTFDENLTLAGLSSPFEKDALKDIMDKIHAIAVGCQNYVGDESLGAA